MEVKKMDKKGQVAILITTIISLVIAIVLFVNLAFPQVRSMTNAQETTETLSAHILGAGATSDTLTNTDLVSGGLTVTGLTLTTHYTVDYDAATVTILNATANGTYVADYSYYDAGYIETTGTRSMAAVLILVLIIGLAVGGLKMFGVM